MSDPTAKKWEVSKGRNAALSRVQTLDGDTDRYRMLSNSVRELRTEDEVVEEIGKLWQEAQEKFLAIGRYLLRAKRQFHRSFEGTILPQLPFGKGVAYQLRAVATAVDEGRVLEDELPYSYATAYQLVSLSVDHLALARSKNLVRRDVLRREIETFKANLNNRSEIDTEARLIQEWRELQLQLQRIITRKSEIESAIGPTLKTQGLL